MEIVNRKEHAGIPLKNRKQFQTRHENIEGDILERCKTCLKTKQFLKNKADPPTKNGAESISCNQHS